ncbi:hypothetical protein [Glaciimonas sp. PCH181]|uniref:hypothetical protein n=1 Tax=Glaciimonas sp. PCH181 TaxID=2133943 RepID=UPI000D3B3EDC|nr:hypothetical protein [Glaciimonas sp. PCH181]PUA19643.1 hypothetical protein C7W93_07305 [Glaciimonas sp. PCH181]
MTAPLKDFNDLKSLQQKLKLQEEVRLAEAAERLRREQQADRDADTFRKNVGGNIQPLTSNKKK